MRPRILALGLPEAALEGWMAAANRDAASMAAAGDYQPFAVVQEAALGEVLAERRLDPPASDKRALLEAMAGISPRDGAQAAFRTAADAGLTVMALTNGAIAATRGLLERAGFLGFFAHVVSTDEVRLAKPRPEVYRYGCEVAGVAPAELALVAAHPWDTQGAAAAGLTTAYLDAERPYPPAMRRPDVQADTLAGCVEALLALPS